MTPTHIAALSGILLLGASVPSVSVLTVCARSAAFGFMHGALTSAGIVVGDILFILTAIYGLSLLTDLMGSHFALIKYLGGAYLIWLGVTLWRSRPRAAGIEAGRNRTLSSSFLAGLLITLGDQKAILFYLGFFPAFIDLSKTSLSDASLILVVATLAVGIPKLLYALVADKARLFLATTRAGKALHFLAGSTMLGVGSFLIATA